MKGDGELTILMAKENIPMRMELLKNQIKYIAITAKKGTYFSSILINLCMKAAGLTTRDTVKAK